MNKNKMHKWVISSILGIMIGFSVGGSAYAKDGDIHSPAKENLGGIGQILLNGNDIIFDMILNLDKYTYELGGKLYNASTVNDTFNKNSEKSLEIVMQAIKTDLVPVEDLPVVDGQGSITVNFIDQDTKLPIATPVTTLAKVGVVSPAYNKAISGYTFMSVTGNSSLVYTTNAQTVTISYKKISSEVPRDGQAILNSFVGSIGHNSKLYKVSDTIFELEVVQKETNGIDNLIYEDSVLNKLTLNGVAPTTVVKVKNSDTMYNTYTITMGSSISDTDVLLKIKDITLDTYPLAKADSEFTLVSTPKAVVPVDEIVTPEMQKAFGQCFGIVASSSNLIKIGDKVLRLDIQKDISYGGYTLEYEKGILNALRVGTTKPVKVVKVASVSSSYNSYEITTEDSIVSGTRYNLSMQQMYLDGHPTADQIFGLELLVK